MLDLVDYDIVNEIGKVLTYGAKKYSPNSWQTIDDAENRYFAALLRHLFAYRKGEILDPESGLPHMSHAAANVMFLNYFQTNKKENG